MIKTKSPLPMVPVSEALETVLTETAKLLWFRRQETHELGGDASSSQPPSSTTCTQSQLIGRLSAEDIKACHPGYPDHNSSIMDGYAVRTSDLDSARDVYNNTGAHGDEQNDFVLDFAIVGKVYAGDDDVTVDKAGQYNNLRTAVYITTGAVVPHGYDAVIPIEETTYLDNKMQIIPSKVRSVLNTKPGTWIRTIGCDISPGSTIVNKGEMIQPVHLALLAQAGVSLEDVKVKELVRIGVLSTGNELQQKANGGEVQNGSGKIPDVNRPLLLSQLSSYGSCELVDLGIVSDDEGLDTIAERLNGLFWGDESEQSNTCNGSIDVLITTGGISMGEKDIMEQVFIQGMGGHVHFGRMNMKPGKPTTFITIDQETSRGEMCRKLVFALPGNPVSASVCTDLLVRPCLDLIHRGVDINNMQAGLTLSTDSFVQHAVGDAKVHDEVLATLASDVKLDNERPEYHRVALQRVLTTNTTGASQQYSFQATSTGVQRSSRVLSLRNADGLMVLPRGGPLGCGYDVAKKGMQFPVLLYSSMAETFFKDSIHRSINAAKDKVLTPRLKLGVIVCRSESQACNTIINDTLVQSLGGERQVVLMQEATCTVPSDTKMQSFIRELTNNIYGQSMGGVNVIFVVVQSDDDSDSAFRVGLEVAHVLRPIVLKNANAMAMQLRKGAVSEDGIAALFENVVGTVREGSAVLLTCSDRGLQGAVGAVRESLRHLATFLD